MESHLYHSTICILKRFRPSSVTFLSFDVEPNKRHQEARTSSSKDAGCPSSVSGNWPIVPPSFKLSGGEGGSGGEGWGVGGGEGGSNERRLAVRQRGSAAAVTATREDSRLQTACGGRWSPEVRAGGSGGAGQAQLHVGSSASSPSARP